MDAITEPHSLGVADAAYSRLRSDILGGELLPGMKLKLDALRERYDVSVNTLRETLSRLAADGLVEAEGQRGFTVVPATLADLIDITETRRLLEQVERLQVDNARDKGWSWADIAKTVGVSKQAVHEKHAQRRKALGKED